MARQYRVEDVLTGVQTLRLRPGDILALLYAGRLSPEANYRLERALRAIVPDSVKCIVLQEGMTLARVTTEAAEDARPYTEFAEDAGADGPTR
jgi:hypothetical protein